eukprot:1392244-Amorphochlora_amoeboformis.AAC.2
MGMAVLLGKEVNKSVSNFLSGPCLRIGHSSPRVTYVAPAQSPENVVGDSAQPVARNAEVSVTTGHITQKVRHPRDTLPVSVRHVTSHKEMANDSSG